MKIAFHTLGCKVNQYETDALKENFKSKGHEIAEDESFADVYVINTCTVTSLADRKSRQYIRRAKKLNPQSIIAVTGCYAQVSPEEAASIDGVDFVIGNDDKMNIPEQLEKFLVGMSITDTKKSKDVGMSSNSDSRTRAFIKVQDGCDRFCSYCIIPYARGKLQSRPIEHIISETKNLIDKGFKEIVLTGINAALYGADMDSELQMSDRTGVDMDSELRISDVNDANAFGKNSGKEVLGIESVIKELNALDGDFRIRLGSLEPTVIDANYIKKLLKYEKLCHHMHLSLQSGSDNVLKSMNRKYNIDEYMQIIKVLEQFDPEYGISTDIIVGFPGETNDDFVESLKITENVDFCKVHVFKYSNRKGTAASKMSGQIDGTEKSRRSAKLITTGDASAIRFFKKNLTKEKKVLIEEFVKKLDCYTGYTDNYIKVYIDKKYFNDNCTNSDLNLDSGNGSNKNRQVRSEISKNYINEFVNVRLTGIFEDGMLAEPV